MYGTIYNNVPFSIYILHKMNQVEFYKNAVYKVYLDKAKFEGALK